MTGSGNNTYLLVGRNGSATLIDAGVGEPRHLAELTARARRRRGSTPSSSRTATAITPRARRRSRPRIPHASFSKLPWPDEDAQYEVPWRPLDDGDVVPAGDDRAAGAAHAGTLAGSPGVLA